MSWYASPNGRATGIGDIEVGIKYRFVDMQNDGFHQLGVFPMVELATGSVRRGLGNGRSWYRLTLWVHKSVGAWTFDGGGVIVNPAPGKYEASFGGALAQYTLYPRWTLGAELFSPERIGGRALWNDSGTCLHPEFRDLEFSIGLAWSD